MPGSGQDISCGVVSYNVHQCVGMDGRRVPERIARVLRNLKADIVGLQEVDSPSDDDRVSDQMRYLATATGLQAIAGPTIQRHRGHYGNVLLTRHPIRVVRRLDLSVPGREPRGAIDVDLDCMGATVRVLATHLGLRSVERRTQVRRLLTALAEARSPDYSSPLIVLGDINEWFLLRPTLRWLNSRLGKTPALRTFPASFPLFALDRIWVQPRSALVTLDVCRTALTRIASDHLPLRATINWYNPCPPHNSGSDSNVE